MKPDFTEIGVLTRHPANPLLTAADVPYPCSLLFNAGVCKWQGRYVMVFRNDFGPKDAAEYRQRRENEQPGFDGTNLGLAISDDGVRWQVADKPLISLDEARKLFVPLAPHEDPASTVGRFYDPRLTVCEGRLYMAFAVDTRHGLRGGIAATDDLQRWELLTASVPDNRNMALFPEKVGGRFVRLERPVNAWGGNWLEDDSAKLWMSFSPDLRYWGDSQYLLSSGEVAWANSKIGPAAPPVRTDRGWLTTFHAVWRHDDQPHTQGWEPKWPKTYSAGLMLLDLEDPSRIIGRCERPLLAPAAWYETGEGEGVPCDHWGFRPHVIFPGGMLLEDSGEVKVYYGASDTVECLATGHVDDLVKACLDG